MPSDKSEYDATVVVVAIVAFALPLTLLVPDFSIWNVIPKFRVTRYHILSQNLTWHQMNAALVLLLTLLFCLYLEIRKRRLDDIVEKVLAIRQVADTTMDLEGDRQAAAMKMCVRLLDTSAEHYESLMLLRNELRKREKPTNQMPPAIELSCSEF